jgi:predicted nucleotidyltransferase
MVYTKLQSKIFTLLCKNAGIELNQRTIASLLKVSPTAVSKALKTMGDIINIKKEGDMNLLKISLNRDSDYAIRMKRVENLRQIYESRLPDFLKESFPGSDIILFGSYSLGEDTVKSDIDIAIIDSKKKDLDLKKYETLLQRIIYINIFRSLDNINTNLKENILYGFQL